MNTLSWAGRPAEREWSRECSDDSEDSSSATSVPPSVSTSEVESRFGYPASVPFSFPTREVVSRFGYAVSVPLCATLPLLDLIAGVAAGALGAVMVVVPGIDGWAVRNFSEEELQAGSKLVSRTFQSVVKTINPSQNFRPSADFGFFADSLATPLQEFARSMAGTGSAIGDERHFAARQTLVDKAVCFLKTQLVARGAYALCIPVIAATRVADAALGLVAAAFVLVSSPVGAVLRGVGFESAAGGWTVANDAASVGLDLVGVVPDTIYLTMAALNPQAMLTTAT